MPALPNLSWLSRMIGRMLTCCIGSLIKLQYIVLSAFFAGLGPRFQHTLVGLLDLGYKCRIRLPLFISAGFVLCHIFSVYLPTVEINVEVIEENRAGLEEEDDYEEEEEETEEEEELSLADSDSGSEAEFAAVVHILNSSRPGGD